MKPEAMQAEPAKQAKRLCSEIQLFDLCDLERCKYKDGRYCTDKDLLARFENIPEEEDSAPPQGVSEELDGDEDADGLGFDDGAEEDPLEIEGEDWEE